MIKSIISAQLKRFSTHRNDEGFTDYIKGPEKRYIVGLTNNTTKSKTWDNARKFMNKKITRQILDYGKMFDIVTIGGRKDDNTGIKFLDVGTAVDNLDEALELAREYNQLAIYDSEVGVSIYL